MKQTDPHFKIRLPPDLKETISEAAKASKRSMNAEIVARLSYSFDIETGPAPDYFQRVLAQLAEALLISSKTGRQFAVLVEVIDRETGRRAADFPMELVQGPTDHTA